MDEILAATVFDTTGPEEEPHDLATTVTTGEKTEMGNGEPGGEEVIPVDKAKPGVNTAGGKDDPEMTRSGCLEASWP